MFGNRTVSFDLIPGDNFEAPIFSAFRIALDLSNKVKKVLT